MARLGEWQDLSQSYNDQDLKLVWHLRLVPASGWASVYVNQRVDGTWFVDIFKNNKHTILDITPDNLEEAKALALMLYHME